MAASWGQEFNSGLQWSRRSWKIQCWLSTGYVSQLMGYVNVLSPVLLSEGGDDGISGACFALPCDVVHGDSRLLGSLISLVLLKYLQCFYHFVSALRRWVLGSVPPDGKRETAMDANT